MGSSIRVRDTPASYAAAPSACPTSSAAAPAQVGYHVGHGAIAQLGEHLPGRQKVRGSSPRRSTTPTRPSTPVSGGGLVMPGPARAESMSENAAMTSPSDVDTETTRPRIDRYDPAADRAALAAALGGARAPRHRPGGRDSARLLPAHDVPLPVGRPAHRSLVHRHAHGRAGALHAHERPQRLPAHRLRRLRPAGGERGHQVRRPPGDLDAAQHRQHAPPVPHHGRRARLVGGGRDLSAGVLPLEPVDLPAVHEGRPGLPPDGTRGLVPQGPGRAGPGAGGRRRPCLLALRHAGHQARPGAVVLPHHEIRRRAARLHRHRLAGAGAPHADELDRPFGGRGRRLPHRSLRPSRRRRRAARLHDPAGHALRGDLHGPRPGASPGRGADGTRAARDRGGLRGRGTARDGDRAPLHRAREDGRAHRRGGHQSRQRRAHPHLDRRLRAGLLRHRRHHGRAGTR